MTYQSPAPEKSPACPTCSSSQTSYCGETGDGTVYLCSPCCEAFFAEEESSPFAFATGGPLRSAFGRAYSGTGVFLLVLTLLGIGLFLFWTACRDEGGRTTPPPIYSPGFRPSYSPYSPYQPVRPGAFSGAAPGERHPGLPVSRPDLFAQPNSSR